MRAAAFELIDDLTDPVETATINPVLDLQRKYGLRPYQAEAIVALDEGWSDDVQAQLVVAATGTGKTVLFTALAKRNREQGGRTLILAHTDELVEQAIEKYAKLMGLRAEKEKAHSYASRFAMTVVASVQTLAGRTRLITWKKDHFSLVIVDESHRAIAASYQKVLQHFMAGGARVVGVTATPDRGDKKSLGTFFQRIAYDFNLVQAVRDGWLVRPIVKTMPVQIDLNGVRTKQHDFDQTEVAHRLVPFMSAIAAKIKEHAAQGKIIIFLPSVETAQLMAQHMNAVGIPSDWVAGISDDRKAKIEAYKSGRLQCICNMALLTEGFDHDTIDTMVILRPTKSRGLYCQMVGRGTRPLNTIIPALSRAENALERSTLIAESPKPHVTILDFLWLYQKHDLCRPASLATDNEEAAEKATKECQEGDILAAAERAERDLLAKLEAEVRKHANRRAQTVDPLALATEMGDLTLAHYEPLTKRDAKPPTPEQLATLRRNGVDTSRIQSLGQAGAIIAKLVARHRQGLCSARQMNFLHTLGVDASHMKQEEAHRRINEWTQAQGGRKDVIA